jgi:dipeptide transport system permease protein
MLRFIFTRLALVIPTFIGITLLAFLLIHAVPGDPIETLAGERGIPPERHAELLHEYGFDRPLYVQYFAYIEHVLSGDLGRSLITHEPVISEFKQLFPATIELALSAMLFAVLIGLPAGILAAARRNSILDHGVMAISVTGYSMPIFWWGLLAILLFSNTWHLTPVSGRIDYAYFPDPVTGFLLIDSLLSDQSGAFRSAVSHLILPMIVLGTIPLAVIARMTRSSMLEVLGEDYIRTARAKGLAPSLVIGVHALRNALIPVITLLGVIFGFLMAGNVVVEMVFAWPGLGHYAVTSLMTKDPGPIQSFVLFVAVMYVFVNLAVDLLYGLADPRIRLR